MVWHGVTRHDIPQRDLRTADFVLTTYQHLLQTGRDEEGGEGGSDEEDADDHSVSGDEEGPAVTALHKEHWQRVILDEGHVMASTKAMRTQAACTLSAESKWILTGTPIRNRPEDLVGLGVFVGWPSVAGGEYQRLVTEVTRASETTGATVKQANAAAELRRVLQVRGFASPTTAAGQRLPRESRWGSSRHAHLWDWTGCMAAMQPVSMGIML